MYFLLKMWIFHCYVSLPGGKISNGIIILYTTGNKEQMSNWLVAEH